MGSSVNFITQPDFSHVWPADVNSPEEITSTCYGDAMPLPVGNCGYDTAGNILKYLLPNIVNSTITEVNERTDDWRSQGIVKKFDQQEFVDQAFWKHSGLDKYGYVFYPN
jgi:hypothetical protein